MRRIQIRRKEVARLIEDAKNQKISFKLDRLESAEVVELEDAKILLLNRTPALIVFPDGRVIPHLQGLGRITVCPIVVVDKGAVEYVVKGADVMIPGVVKHSSFSKGEPVAVVSEEYVAIAVGVALQGSETITKGTRGKIVKNLHKPNDKFFTVLSGPAESVEDA
ncbi:MAG: PUA domain-containing protein [Thermoproteota archaeon]